MAQQTAVDIMFEKAISVLPLEFFYSKGILKETYLQAKEMEKQEQAKCWIASAKYGLKILNTGEKADFKAAFEQYYTETYGK
jgi:hypothetical protein